MLVSKLTVGNNIVRNPHPNPNSKPDRARGLGLDTIPNCSASPPYSLNRVGKKNSGRTPAIWVGGFVRVREFIKNRFFLHGVKIDHTS